MLEARWGGKWQIRLYLEVKGLLVIQWVEHPVLGILRVLLHLEFKGIFLVTYLVEHQWVGIPGILLHLEVNRIRLVEGLVEQQ